MRRLALALLVTGCGRIGFAEVSPAVDGGADALQRGPINVSTTAAFNSGTNSPEVGVPIFVTDETGTLRDMVVRL